MIPDITSLVRHSRSPIPEGILPRNGRRQRDRQETPRSPSGELAIRPLWRRTAWAAISLLSVLAVLAIVVVYTRGHAVETTPILGALRLVFAVPTVVLFSLAFAMAPALPATLLVGGSLTMASLAIWITHEGVADLVGRAGSSDATEVFMTFTIVLGALVHISGGLLGGARSQARANQMSGRDFLTGLLNREGFHQHWSNLTPGQLCALALIDLNLLKGINDNAGHAAGDEHLKSVSTVLMERLPSTTLVSRWGGDEFLILAPGQGEDELRAELASLEGLLPDVASAVPVWAVGITSLETGNPLDVAFGEADERMYQAKREQYRQAGIDTSRGVFRGNDVA